VYHSRPFRLCSAMVFLEWQDRHRVCKLQSLSPPPSSSGMMWSTLASDPLTTRPQSVQTLASRIRILARLERHSGVR
jgi:hypothetical protein